MIEEREDQSVDAEGGARDGLGLRCFKMLVCDWRAETAGCDSSD